MTAEEEAVRVAGTGPPLPAPVSAVNIANVLTVGRFLLVPVFGVFMFADGGHTSGWRIAAAATYAVAAFTDQIDGYVARRRGIVTDFGKLADPLADKALTGAALISLSVLGDLPWAVTVIVLFRELAVTVLRLWVVRIGVIAASRGGKIKTLLLNLAIGMYVLPLSGAWGTARALVMAAGVVLALFTGVDYTARALALHRRPKDGP